MRRIIYLIIVHGREALLRRLDALASKAVLANDRQRARDEALGHSAVTTKPTSPDGGAVRPTPAPHPLRPHDRPYLKP